MRLSSKDFKRLKELESKKDLSDAEKEELIKLKSLKESGNAPEFYVPTEQAKRDLASFTQNLMQGITVVDSGINMDLVTVCILKYHPVVDSKASHTNGITLAARDMYQYIRSGQSGSTNYQGVDIELFIQGILNITENIRMLKRWYKLSSTYDNLNLTWPTAIFRSVFGNVTLLPDIGKNISDFRGKINNLVRQLSTFNVPSDIPCMSVRAHLVDNVFVEEADNKRSQLYMYLPASILLYNQTKYQSGGCLERIPISYANINTYADFVQAFIDPLEAQIAAFKADSIITTMNGDIYRKYEKDGKLDRLLAYKEISELETIAPMFDQYTLERIRHATVLGNHLVYGDIVQKNNCLWNPVLTGIARKRASADANVTLIDGVNRVIQAYSPGTITPAQWQVLVDETYNGTSSDFYSGSSDVTRLTSSTLLNYEHPATLDMNIEATRHTVLVSGVKSWSPTLGGTAYGYAEITHGSEIIVACEIWTSANSDVSGNFYTYPTKDRVDMSSMLFVGYYQSLKFAPMMRVVNTIGATFGAGKLPEIVGVCTDIDEFAVLQYLPLRNLNITCMITEFTSNYLSGTLSRLNSASGK